MGKTVALIGNPNCGKTSLFNALTGSNQYVGNWAGVTVEKKTGRISKYDIDIIDLPGIYSLSPYSSEEIVTKDFLLNEKPDLILNIIDGTNFQRNFYLTLQLLSLKIPIIIAVNMMDEVKQKGISIDFDYIEKLLNIKVIPISAKKKENIDKVIDEITKKTTKTPSVVHYDYKTQKALNSISEIICSERNIPYGFYSEKILEGDILYRNELKLDNAQNHQIDDIIKKYQNSFELRDKDILIAEARYRYIQELYQKTFYKKTSVYKETISDKIDKVLTNKIVAFPIFFMIMGLIFTLTFGKVGSFFENIITVLIYNKLSPFVLNTLERSNCSEWIINLVCNGIIGGVGGVLKFFPRIAILFFCLSLLEDSGYMARAAFISDSLLKKLGLSGKSFIPMLMGLGCTTTGIMASRTQENSEEQKMTILLLPFMSCGAKLTIYSLFASVFFPDCAGLIVISLYALGFLMFIIMGMIFKKTLFKKADAGFIMELPPYRIPELSSVLKNAWDKTKGFIIKAGTIIFIMSIIIWFFQNFSINFTYVKDSSQSIFGSFGNSLVPIFKSIGFGEWKPIVSLLSGFVAKEAVVSTLGVLYSGTNTITEALKSAFSPLSAYTYMVFCLLYPPCISAYGAMKNELKSFKLTFFSIAMQIFVAYAVSFIIYQIGLCITNIF